MTLRKSAFGRTRRGRYSVHLAPWRSPGTNVTSVAQRTLRSTTKVKHEGKSGMRKMPGSKYQGVPKSTYRSSCTMSSLLTNLLKSTNGSSGSSQFRGLALLGSSSLCLTAQRSWYAHSTDFPSVVEFTIDKCGGFPMPVPDVIL